MTSYPIGAQMYSLRDHMTDEKGIRDVLKAVKKMGALKKLVGLLPGMNKMEDKIDLDASQARLDQYKVIMDSMTMQEKDEPNLIKGKRIERIARGAGVTTADVKELLKQYNNSKKMMGAVGKDRKILSVEVGGKSSVYAFTSWFDRYLPSK